MRTTVELPSSLLKRAKSRAAERGETLKGLFARAVAAEIGRGGGDELALREHVRLPLFGDPAGPPVRLTSKDVARALTNEDVANARRRLRRG